MRKLRIAQFVTSEVPFPIPLDFGTPYAPVGLSADIAEILSQKGHEVVYFGPKGSKAKNFKVTEIDLQPIYHDPVLRNNVISKGSREKIDNLFDQYYISKILIEHRRRPFDIIHIHQIDHALVFGLLFPEINFVYTLHDRISPWRAKAYQSFQTDNQSFISISDTQRRPAPNLKFFATVHNGIDLNHFPFSNNTGDYLLLIGRLNQYKGVQEAVKVAKLTQKDLLLVGPKDEIEYWKVKIEPLLDKTIQHKNFVPNNKTHQYYQQAKIFLMPIMWEEPFGLVVPEANACGTPVVAFARGSMPELIKDGYNGFLIKPGDIKAMAKAVQRIYDMPDTEYLKMRQNCRKHVEDNFSIEKMVDGYEQVYQQIINK